MDNKVDNYSIMIVRKYLNIFFFLIKEKASITVAVSLRFLHCIFIVFEVTFKLFH